MGDWKYPEFTKKYDALLNKMIEVLEAMQPMTPNEKIAVSTHLMNAVILFDKELKGDPNIPFTLAMQQYRSNELRWHNAK